MDTQHINDICIIKYNSFLQIYRIKDSWSTIDFPESCNIIGFGNGGHLMASFYAYIQQSDASFLRYHPKKYGACNQIDGMYSPMRVSILFCNIKEIPELLELIKRFHISFLKVFTFDEREKQQMMSQCYDFKGTLLGIQPVESKAMTNYVELLAGKTFTLSSGKQVDQYYETLPAANRYELISGICNVLGKEVDRFSREMIIGIAYGGTYFSVAVALTFGMNPTIFEPSSNIVINDQLRASCLFLDDFVSTGTNFMKAAAFVDEKYVESSRYMSIYSIMDEVMVHDTYVDILCKIPVDVI